MNNLHTYSQLSVRFRAFISNKWSSLIRACIKRLFSSNVPKKYLKINLKKKSEKKSNKNIIIFTHKLYTVTISCSFRRLNDNEFIRKTKTKEIVKKIYLFILIENKLNKFYHFFLSIFQDELFY